MTTLSHRYFIELAFKGTHYHGWQIQHNALTVQQLVNESLRLQLQEPIETTGVGRTDSGVHAKYFVAHFDCSHDNLHENKDLLRKANQILPRDIVILSMKKMHPTAHARFDALSRTYQYHLCLNKDPFNLEFATFIHEIPDIDLMNMGALIIKQTNDFTSFSKLHTDVKTNFCRIDHSCWTRIGNMMVYTIQADRFLRNMVRAITGTLLDLGRQKITIEIFQKIIEKKDRSLAGNSMPAQGLFLTNIKYPDDYNLLCEQITSY